MVREVDGRPQLGVELINCQLYFQVVAWPLFDEVDEVLAAVSHIVDEVKLVFEVYAPFLAHHLRLPVVHFFEDEGLLHRRQQGSPQPVDFDTIAGQGQHCRHFDSLRFLFQLGRNVAEVPLSGLLQVELLIFLLFFACVHACVLLASIDISLIRCELELLKLRSIQFAHNEGILAHVWILAASS